MHKPDHIKKTPKLLRIYNIAYTNKEVMRLINDRVKQFHIIADQLNQSLIALMKIGRKHEIKETKMLEYAAAMILYSCPKTFKRGLRNIGAALAPFNIPAQEYLAYYRGRFFKEPEWVFIVNEIMEAENPEFKDVLPRAYSFVNIREFFADNCAMFWLGRPISPAMKKILAPIKELQT